MLFCGELSTHWAVYRVIEGLVIDGVIRNQVAVRKIKFCVIVHYVHLARGDKGDPGGINYPIFCGNINVNPKDTIVRDNDGVVKILSNNYCLYINF